MADPRRPARTFPRPDDFAKLPAPPPMTPPAEEACPPVAPFSVARIPLVAATFGPGVTDDGKTREEVRGAWPGCEDLALDVALGCVTWGVYLVPLANVRAMVRAAQPGITGSGT